MPNAPRPAVVATSRLGPVNTRGAPVVGSTLPTARSRSFTPMDGIRPPSSEMLLSVSLLGNSAQVAPLSVERNTPLLPATYSIGWVGPFGCAGLSGSVYRQSAT